MAFQKFPMCLYKRGTLPLAGLLLSATTVHSEEELAAALADGWKADPAETVAPAAPVTAAQTDEEAAPTRAELEQQANKLGIEFRSNISDATLAARIAAKLTAEGAASA